MCIKCFDFESYMEYMGSNLHSVTILHFFSSVSFFSRKFSKFYAGPLALLTVSGCRTSSHCLIIMIMNFKPYFLGII